MQLNNYTIQFHHSALRDVQRIAETYERKSAGLGYRLISEMELVLEHIRQFPRIYQLAFSDIRRALLKNFPCAVAYSVEDFHIKIWAIYPTQQDPFITTQIIGQRTH